MGGGSKIVHNDVSCLFIIESQFMPAGIIALQGGNSITNI